MAAPFCASDPPAAATQDPLQWQHQFAPVAPSPPAAATDDPLQWQHPFCASDHAGDTWPTACQARALQQREPAAGQRIVTQGERGEAFFVLMCAPAPSSALPPPSADARFVLLRESAAHLPPNPALTPRRRC